MPELQQFSPSDSGRADVSFSLAVAQKILAAMLDGTPRYSRHIRRSTISKSRPTFEIDAAVAELGVRFDGSHSSYVDCEVERGVISGGRRFVSHHRADDTETIGPSLSFGDIQQAWLVEALPFLQKLLHRETHMLVPDLPTNIAIGPGSGTATLALAGTTGAEVVSTWSVNSAASGSGIKPASITSASTTANSPTFFTFGSSNISVTPTSITIALSDEEALKPGVAIYRRDENGGWTNLGGTMIGNMITAATDKLGTFMSLPPFPAGVVDLVIVPNVPQVGEVVTVSADGLKWSDGRAFDGLFNVTIDGADISSGTDDDFETLGVQIAAKGGRLQFRVQPSGSCRVVVHVASVLGGLSGVVEFSAGGSQLPPEVKRLAVVPGASRADISWAAEGARAFRLRYGADTNFTGENNIESTPSAVITTATNLTLTGLVPGKDYLVEVVAVEGDKFGLPAIVSFTAAPLVAKPAPAGGVVATALSNSLAIVFRLSGDDLLGDRNIAFYEIYIGTNVVATPNAGTPFATVALGLVPKTVDAVVSVVAVDQAGNRSDPVFAPIVNPDGLPWIPVPNLVLTRSAEGAVLDFRGSPSQLVVIETSVNLIKWTPYLTNSLGSDGVLRIPINTALGAVGFFRGRVPATITPPELVSFVDDFSRADGVVANGWSTFSQGTVAPPVIESGELTAPRAVASGLGAIYRPFPHGTNGIRMRATIVEGSGNGGLRARFHHYLATRSEGGFDKAYALLIQRSNESFSNSALRLLDGGVEVGNKIPPFEFSGSMEVDISFNADGSLDVKITSLGLMPWTTSFPPRQSSSQGAKVEVGMEYGGDLLRKRMDNLTIEQVP